MPRRRVIGQRKILPDPKFGSELLAMLFEVKQRVKELNAGRQHDAPGHRLEGSSYFFSELQAKIFRAHGGFNRK